MSTQRLARLSFYFFYLQWVCTKSLIKLVGAARFELAALCSQSRCATRLRYAPSIQHRLYVTDAVAGV